MVPRRALERDANCKAVDPSERTQKVMYVGSFRCQKAERHRESERAKRFDVCRLVQMGLDRPNLQRPWAPK